MLGPVWSRSESIAGVADMGHGIPAIQHCEMTAVDLVLASESKRHTVVSGLLQSMQHEQSAPLINPLRLIRERNPGSEKESAQV